MITNRYTNRKIHMSGRTFTNGFISPQDKRQVRDPKLVLRSLIKPQCSKSKRSSQTNRRDINTQRPSTCLELDHPKTDRGKVDVMVANPKVQLKLAMKFLPRAVTKKTKQVNKTLDINKYKQVKLLKLSQRSLEIEDIILKEPYYSKKEDIHHTKVVKLRKN